MIMPNRTLSTPKKGELRIYPKNEIPKGFRPSNKKIPMFVIPNDELRETMAYAVYEG